MDELPIFTAALELEAPWYIKKVYFEGTGTSKKLHIDFCFYKLFLAICILLLTSND